MEDTRCYEDFVFMSKGFGSVPVRSGRASVRYTILRLHRDGAFMALPFTCTIFDAFMFMLATAIGYD